MSYRTAKARRIFRSEGLASLIVSAAKNALPHPLNRWFALAHTEYTTMGRFPMSRQRRLSLWRRGFLSQSDVLYGLERTDDSEYLTDYQRYVKTPQINGQWSIAVGNKLLFHDVMHPFDEYLPALYGYLCSGRFHHVDADGTGTSDAGEWLTDRLQFGEKLVVKYVKGGGGSGVNMVEYVNGEYYIDGEAHSEREFIDEIATLEEHIVTEYVEQADYAADLYPESPNTIRVLTMYDDKAGKAFLATQIHRIGTAQTGGLDNFSQGGISAAIDVDTGCLSKAAQFSRMGGLTWHATHPDTGARIEGITVPGWDDIIDQLLTIATDFSHIPYIGWDLLVTEDGEFKILEANNQTDVDLLQVHGGLLADPQTAEFYQRHNVV